MKKAIITVYYPDEENSKNVEKIAEQVDRVIVCDNSPSENKSLFLNEKVEYIFFGENLGLSAAFNRVLSKSENWKDEDYIIFFDQDSTIESGHIEKLIEIYEELQKNEANIGCLGPVYYNNSSGMVEIPKQKKLLMNKTYEVQSIITSSMLTKYENLKSIGFWNEKTFLDMADWDLCWRLMDSGRKCCMTENVVLKHTLGNGEKKIAGIRLRVGSTIRDYYQTRDCLYLLKEEYTPFKYKCRFILMLTVRAWVRLIFLDDRKKRLHYIMRGHKDYRSNICGVYR